jgi:two-component system, LuxR family, sensor kinase FixL
VTDITERKLAEEAYRTLVDSALQGLVIVQDGRLVFANPAYCKMSGYTANELRALPRMGFLKTMLAEDRAVILRRYRLRMAGSSVPADYPIRILRKDGRVTWVEVRVASTLFRSRPALQVAFVDITGRKQAEDERRNLEQMVMEASERERQRIGRDLHDSLGQVLAGLSFNAHALQRQLAGKDAAAAGAAAQIAGHLRSAVSQARGLASALHPVPPEPDGLTVGLQTFCRTVRELFGVRCRVDCADAVRVRDPGVATHLYRIAQEAVHNAIRHGKATEIRIVLRARKNVLTLRVRDNGKGFPAARQLKSGMGLATMRYRADAAGGAFTIGPTEPRGTVVTCQVPMPEAAGGTRR